MNMSVNFGYKKNDRVLYIANLSQNNQQEIFFRFLFSKQKATQYYDGITKTEESITSIDHLSIHRDGNVHVKYYDSKKKEKKIPHNKLKPLVEMPHNYYLPLFILSLYNIEACWDYVGRSTPLEYKGFAGADFTWNIHDFNQFSLVFFLVGGNVNGGLMLQNHFPSIFDVQTSPVLTNCFGNEINILRANELIHKENDLRLLIGHTKKVILKPTPKEVMGPKELKQHDRIEIPLGFIVSQSDDTINRLV